MRDHRLVRSIPCLLGWATFVVGCRSEVPPSPPPSSASATPPPPSPPASGNEQATSVASAPIEAEEEPGLPPQVVQGVVREHYHRMRTCYEAGLERDPALVGRVVVHFTIGAEGTAHVLGDPESTLPSVEVRECVKAVFAQLEFPKPTKVVTVTYPISFEP